MDLKILLTNLQEAEKYIKNGIIDTGLIV